MKEVSALIYLDNAATTKPCEQAVNAATEALMIAFGNPSSRHFAGLDADRLVIKARDAIANALSCREDEVFFTSGATESNNTAILGACENRLKRMPKVVTTTVEHPSVKAAFDKLEKMGAQVTRVAPDENGEITAKMLFDAVDEKTCLISAMLVNNETGYVLPIERAFSMIKKSYPDCITHCDAVQGFMKIHVKPSKLSADLVSVSGHKIYAPKGVGVLYVKKGVHIAPFMLGGGQEKAFRSGTENVPAIAGMGAAVELLCKTVDERYEKANALRDYIINSINELDGVFVNSKETASPYVVSISMPNYKSETLLNYMSDRGICVSSGSACSKGKKSSVLQEFKISPERTDATLRLSFSGETQISDIDEFLKNLRNAQNELCTVKINKK